FFSRPRLSRLPMFLLLSVVRDCCFPAFAICAFDCLISSPRESLWPTHVPGSSQTMWRILTKVLTTYHGWQLTIVLRCGCQQSAKVAVICIRGSVHCIAKRLGINRRNLVASLDDAPKYGGAPCALCEKSSLAAGLRLAEFAET